jgi:hypothetical protein
VTTRGINKQAVIVRVDGKYQVQSEKGRNLGTCDTLEEAEKRLEQVEYFKEKDKKKKNRKRRKEALDKLAYKKKWQEQQREEERQQKEEYSESAPTIPTWMEQWEEYNQGEQQPEEDIEEQKEYSYAPFVARILRANQETYGFGSKESQFVFKLDGVEYDILLVGKDKSSILKNPVLDVTVWIEGKGKINPSQLIPSLSTYVKPGAHLSRMAESIDVPIDLILRELEQFAEIADAVYGAGYWIEPEAAALTTGDVDTTAVREYLSSIPRYGNNPSWFVIPMTAPESNEGIGIAVKAAAHGFCQPQSDLDSIINYNKVQLSIETLWANGTVGSPFKELPTKGQSAIDPYEQDYGRPGVYYMVPLEDLINAIIQLQKEGYTFAEQPAHRKKTAGDVVQFQFKPYQRSKRDNLIYFKCLTNSYNREFVEQFAQSLIQRFGYPVYEKYGGGGIRIERHNERPGSVLEHRDGLYKLYINFEVDEPDDKFADAVEKLLGLVENSRMVREGSVYTFRFSPQHPLTNNSFGTNLGETGQLWEQFLGGIKSRDQEAQERREQFEVLEGGKEAAIALKELSKLAAKRQKIAYKKKWQEQQKEKERQEFEAQLEEDKPQTSMIPTWEEQWEAYMSSEEPEQYEEEQPEENKATLNERISEIKSLFNVLQRGKVIGSNRYCSHDFFGVTIPLSDGTPLRYYMGGRSCVPDRFLENLNEYETVTLFIDARDNPNFPEDNGLFRKWLDTIGVTAIADVIDYSYPNNRLILVDDISPDNIAAIIDKTKMGSILPVANYAGSMLYWTGSGWTSGKKSVSPSGEKSEKVEPFLSKAAEIFNKCEKERYDNMTYIRFDYNRSYLDIDLHCGENWSMPGVVSLADWSLYSHIGIRVDYKAYYNRGKVLALEWMPKLQAYQSGESFRLVPQSVVIELIATFLANGARFEGIDV